MCALVSNMNGVRGMKGSVVVGEVEGGCGVGTADGAAGATTSVGPEGVGGAAVASASGGSGLGLGGGGRRCWSSCIMANACVMAAAMDGLLGEREGGR